jgi:hypothetical protein
MNREETGQLLLALSGAYPTTEVTTETSELWANVFSGESFDALVEAAKVWIDRERFWPTPADLRTIIRDRRRREEMETPPEERQLPAPEPPPEIVPETGEVLSSSQPPPTWERAIEIAYGSYCREVRRQGREPRSVEDFKRQLPRHAETGDRRRGN